MRTYTPTLAEWQQGYEHRTPAYSINSIRESEDRLALTAGAGAGKSQQLCELATRQWRTPSYSISTIPTSPNFAEIFESIVKNLFEQVDFFNTPINFERLRKPKVPVQLELFPNG